MTPSADVLPDTPDVDLWESEPNKFEEGSFGQPEDTPAEPEPTAAEARPLFMSAADLITERQPAAVIEGIAWAGCRTVLVSESGAGKTFALLALAAAVSEGRTWHGRAVRAGSIAYISYEGDALGLRLEALREAGHSLQNVHVLRASNPLSPRVGRDGVESYSMGEAAVSEALKALSVKLDAEGKPPIVLVCIDTVRASMSGSEDSSEHVSAYLRAVARIMAPYPDAAAILAHHAGWQDSTETRRRRERGSSAFRGNVDATLYLEVIEEDPEHHRAFLALRTLKVRDDERPVPLRLIRQRVELLRTNGYGEPMTSCVIERDTRSQADREAEAAAAVTAEDHDIDVKVLKTMRDYPAATSQRALRTYVGLGTDAVLGAIGRLLRSGLALEGRRGQPYQVTLKGLEFLATKGAE